MEEGCRPANRSLALGLMTVDSKLPTRRAPVNSSPACYRLVHSVAAGFEGRGDRDMSPAAADDNTPFASTN